MSQLSPVSLLFIKTDLLWVFIVSIALLVPIDTFRRDEILTGAKTGWDPSTVQLWVSIDLERDKMRKSLISW